MILKVKSSIICEKVKIQVVPQTFPSINRLSHALCDMLRRLVRFTCPPRLIISGLEQKRERLQLMSQEHKVKVKLYTRDVIFITMDMSIRFLNCCEIRRIHETLGSLSEFHFEISDSSHIIGVALNLVIQKPISRNSNFQKLVFVACDLNA